MSLDVSQLPQQLQDYIQQEIAKAVEATKPAPPPELTPDERLDAALVQLQAALNAERSQATGDGHIHAAVYYVLHALVGVLRENKNGSATSASADASTAPLG